MTDREALLTTIREQGLDTGGFSPHSWRCEHPDRYPDYCTCVEEMADAILAAGFHRQPEAITDEQVRWAIDRFHEPRNETWQDAMRDVLERFRNPEGAQS